MLIANFFSLVFKARPPPLALSLKLALLLFCERHRRCNIRLPPRVRIAIFLFKNIARHSQLLTHVVIDTLQSARVSLADVVQPSRVRLCLCSVCHLTRIHLAVELADASVIIIQSRVVHFRTVFDGVARLREGVRAHHRAVAFMNFMCIGERRRDAQRTVRATAPRDVRHGASKNGVWRRVRCGSRASSTSRGGDARLFMASCGVD